MKTNIPTLKPMTKLKLTALGAVTLVTGTLHLAGYEVEVSTPAERAEAAVIKRLANPEQPTTTSTVLSAEKKP